jgi:putative ABC transport system permease protein
MKEHFKLASKNLKRRGIRSWLTMLGIFIGIAAVVSLISLGSGLRNAITGQFGSLDPDKLTIQNSGTGYGPPGSTSVDKLNSHDVDIVKNINGVEMVVSRLIRLVKVEYNGVVQFKYVGSLPESKKEAQMVYDSMSIQIQDGELLEAGEINKVVLGNDFTKEADFGKAVKVSSKLTIQGKDFRVKGIMEKSGSYINNVLILMPERDLKEILNTKDETDLIVVKVKESDNPEKVAADIKEALRKDRNQKEGEEDFSISTPVQSLQSINTILMMINIIVTGIASISLLVGGIGIANTMYTSVLERKKEIGIMKAIGAKNSDVLLIFLIEAGLLGLVGGVVGALIGLGVAMLVANVAQGFLGSNIFGVVISWPLLIFSVSFAFIIGIISGITPASQASKLKPVEALRS